MASAFVRPHLRGIYCMLAASLCFSLMNAAARGLSGALPPLEIAFFRTLVGFVLLTPWMLIRRAPLLGHARTLLLLRGVIGWVSLSLGFFALSRVALADVTLLWKTSVIFTAFFAALFLRERISKELVGLIVLAMLGSALIVKPGGAVLNVGGIAALGAGLCVGIVAVSLRKLHETDESLSIMYAFSIWGTLFGGALCVLNFIVPSPVQAGVLILVGILGSAGQFFFTEAFRSAPASVVHPYQFSEALFALLLGFVLWGDLPDLPAMVGGVLIVAAGLGIMRLHRPPPEIGAPPSAE